MAVIGNSATRVRFGEVEVDLRTGEVLRDGRRFVLSEKPLQLLAALLENPGELVTREQLKKRLWTSDTFVDFDLGLNKTINRLREALADSADQPRYVETLPKRGYRFIGTFDRSEVVSQASNALRTLSPPSEQRAGNRLPLKFILGATAALSIVAIVVLVVRKWIQPPSLPTLTQLTSNSDEVPVRTAAISPDGKQLAFSDIRGLHIKNIETGESRAVPVSQASEGDRVDWQIMGWFPDGGNFLANIAPFEDVCLHCEHFSAWVIPVNGGIPRKIRDDANAESVSPDGSQIAFTANLGMPGGREVWFTDSKGDKAIKVFETNTNEWVRYVKWSPDGRRLSYIRSNDREEILESRDANGLNPVVILRPADARGIHDYIWTSSKKVTYGLEETSAGTSSSNYWQVPVDSRTGVPTAKPQQITNWAGFIVDWTSTSSNGRRLAFVESAKHTIITLLPTDAKGIQKGAARKLTLSESWNLPFGWTPDGKALVFASTRDGRWGIYKQGINEDNPVAVVQGLRDYARYGVVTPGRWILYVVQQVSGTSPELMRVSIDGGSPERVETGRDILGLGCPTISSGSCVMIAPGTDHGELVFYSLSAGTGRGAELMRFSLPSSREEWEWQLSPDGTRAAVFQPSDNHAYLLNLKSRQSQELPLKKLRTGLHIAWARDSQSLLISNATPKGAALMRVDFQGTAKKLWEEQGDLSVSGLPSPEGDFLAITSWRSTGNVRMMQDF